MKRSFTFNFISPRLHTEDSAHSGKIPTFPHRLTVKDLYLYRTDFHGLGIDELGSVILPLTVLLRQTVSSNNSQPLTVQLQKPRTTQFVRWFVSRITQLTLEFTAFRRFSHLIHSPSNPVLTTSRVAPFYIHHALSTKAFSFLVCM